MNAIHDIEFIQETYGEDPYMAGVLVEQFVKGLQGSHERYVRVAAGCKHFDVHGGPENIPTDRFSFDAKVRIGLYIYLIGIFTVNCSYLMIYLHSHSHV